MRHKSPGMCNIFNNLISQQVGFYGRNTETFDAFYLIKSLYQIKKSLSCCLAKITNIHTCQYNFLSTFGSRLAGLLHHRSNAAVTATSAGKGNGAIGTIIIAAVLNL